MAPGRSKLALDYELNTRASLKKICGEPLVTMGGTGGTNPPNPCVAFMRTSIKQKRDFEFVHFPVSYKETAAGFELSGARLPQNRRRFLGGKRGCAGF